VISIARLFWTILVVLLGAAGTYWMLPHRQGATRPPRAYKQGALLASCALGCLLLGCTSPPGPFLATVFFYLFSVAAIAGGLLTVTSRNPVYSALWFASVVLSTAGLFLLAGAPFLAAGTVIVYAGAIIVTFLFVVMLAQMEGKALYDRAARAPGPATVACFLLLWSLVYCLSALKTQRAETMPVGQPDRSTEIVLARARDIRQAHAGQFKPASAVVDRALPPLILTLDSRGTDKPNVAGLGESLYTVHLVTAGLAGVLMFVALVGAVAIANPRRQPKDRPVHQSQVSLARYDEQLIHSRG
jgi:NADH-quinone oxidoreductase subunit J